MNNFARFHFTLTDGKPLVITYELQKNSLEGRWVEQVNDRCKDPNPRFNLNLANKSDTDIQELMEHLNIIVTKLNSYYDKELPLYAADEIDRTKLNYLHEEFENYGARVAEYNASGTFNTSYDCWYTDTFNIEFHETWLKLNEQIHRIEGAMGCNPEEPHFMCAAQFYPFEEGMKINPEDKLFLSTDFNWGELYLGYNTLGKDFMDTCEDNDVRVITNHQIKVQEYFSTEVYLHFGFNKYKKEVEQHFWNWYQNLAPEAQQLIPIHDRNAISLGRYYLGFVVFDQAFLDFHPNYKDWDNENLDLRKRWNIEVFSKIEKITKIEIINLDQYLNECRNIPYIAEMMKEKHTQI